MASKRINFPGAQGVKLAAVLETPDGDDPRAFALFAHCFTCTKDIFSARYVTAGLARRGFAVLRFDFTGLGASEGEFANTNFSSNVQDLLCAAEFMRAELKAPRVIVGHSLGGAAVLAAAGEIPELRAVVSIAAPAEPAHVQNLFTDAKQKIQMEGEAEVLLAGRPFKIKKQFLDDIEGTKLADKIRAMNKALLIFHSASDKTVGIENARKIYEAARHPKSFISLDGADHLLSDKRDAAYVSEVLAAWAGKYLDEAPASTEQKHEGERDDSTVIVAEAGGSGFAQKIYNGKHELIADEPASSGGGNTGPTPYGYLLAGLGACTSMTIRIVARRKNIPLEKVTVTLRHKKIHGEDCESCETKSGMLDFIEREVELQGDLSQEQRAMLLAVSEKCPVHRTLHSEVKIETRLKDK